jgi:hypothetical protein
MSVGPVGGLIGSDVERAQQATGNQERRVQNDLKAERAGGIGEADGDDHEAAERDADGRRPWELRRAAPQPGQPAADAPQSKDASGQSGNLVDLSG